MNNFKIIVYNDVLLSYTTGDILNFDKGAPELIEITGMHDINRKYTINPIQHLSIETYNSEYKETISLDETLMKRIAKYNKEVEIQNLDKKIKEKQEKIKELDNILKDRDKRVEKLKKYIAEIYDIDINDDDEDYEDYDY